MDRRLHPTVGEVLRERDRGSFAPSAWPGGIGRIAADSSTPADLSGARDNGDARPLTAAIVDVMRQLAVEARDDRLTSLAAEVAFFSVLGLFPALLAVASALGFLDLFVGADVAMRARDTVTGNLERILSDDAAATIDAVESLFNTTNPGVLTFGAVAAVWAASRGFTGIIRALDQVYDIEERRGYVPLRVLAVLLSTGTVIVVAVVLAALVVGPLFGAGRSLADEIGGGDAFAAAWDWARWPLVVVVLVAWAATVFHFAPNHRTPWRWELPGAMLTTASWAVLSLGLRIYLAIASGQNQVLGTLGGVLIVLTWLYLLALGLLLGGELNAILAVRHNVEQIPRRSIEAANLWREASRRTLQRIRRAVSAR